MVRDGNHRIVELERRLDPLLRDRATGEPVDPALLAAAREWSEAVWELAERLGPVSPDGAELERGLALAQRPVFICGAARSGTTLLRDLLDGHPRLAVVPIESLFYSSVERALFGLRGDRHNGYLGRRWIEQLAAPPPYWLLGSSTAEHSPYVAFARSFAGWLHAPEQRRQARTASWPLAALALAYAQHQGHGGLLIEAQQWVEKTPASERYLHRIRQDFPEAKIIHIVRQPEAVLASVKSMRPHLWSRRHAVAHIVRLMAPSYRLAAASIGQPPCARYCLIRYEELTGDPATVISEVAEFLGIEPAASLLQPTVTGRPAANNSSFKVARPDVHAALDPIERAVLSLTIARPAAKLGYAPAGPSGSVGHSIVGLA